MNQEPKSEQRYERIVLFKKNEIGLLQTARQNLPKSLCKLALLNRIIEYEKN